MEHLLHTMCVYEHAYDRLDPLDPFQVLVSLHVQRTIFLVSKSLIVYKSDKSNVSNSELCFLAAIFLGSKEAIAML
jgi:hypothetical protein